MDITLIVIFIVVAIAMGIFTPKPKPPSLQDSTTQAEENVASQAAKPASDSGTVSRPEPPPTPKAPPTINSGSNYNVSDWQYPGSTILAATNSSLTLNANADTDTITNWYKEKIKASGANAKSFVTTKANDKVLNKLVGSNGKTEIRVEISKEPGSSVVQIGVTIKSP